MIRLARPQLGDAEVDAVREVLESGVLVQGQQVALFEQTLANVAGRDYAVAVSSGTTALELALRALRIDGGEVLCPDLSWPSPAHAIVSVGARPRFVDVDPSSWNATAERFAAARTHTTAAAIVIDQFGQPADHPAIEIALNGLPWITDAACSLGATVDGRAATSYGRLATTSFHPRKVLTTGEGGAVFTDDPAMAAQLRTLRNHGQESPGRFEVAAGNGRMTDFQAAIGRVQLARLPEMITRRRALADRYRNRLPATLRAQEARPGIASNVQTFGVLLPPGVEPAGRDRVADRLRERGVEAGRLSYALHRLESLSAFAGEGPYPASIALDDRGLALPMHPGLTEADIDHVASSVEAALDAEGIE